MYYLSFDIGIKNLSYFLCKFDDILEVIDWNIISIFSQEKCIKDNCNNLITSYIQPISKTVCKDHLKDISKEYYKKDILSPEKHINFLADCLFKNLNKLVEESIQKIGDNKITIVIEQQPSKNNIMKQISIMLFSFFKLNNHISSVHFINSKNKLKLNTIDFYKNLDNFFENIGYEEAKLKDYKYRKKLSVKIVTELIEKNIITDNNQTFKNSKKKDDLADCFIQLIYFLK